MNRNSRRERLGLVVIAIAALASAATTALPPPTPNLLASQKGTISLTAEAPVAWLDISASQNEALAALQGTTTVKVSAETQADGVLLVAGDPSGYRYDFGGTKSATGQGHCRTEEACKPTVRLFAVLLDPMAHPEAEIGWTATAESHYPQDSGPVAAARLGVDVATVESRPTAAMGLAVTAPETIKLGPDLPRAVRNVRLVLPAGSVRDPILDAGAFLRTTDLDGGPIHRPPAEVRVRRGQNLIGNASWSAELISPLGDCEPGVACETDLSIEFTWNGGSAEGSSIEWSLAAWSGLSTGEPAAPADIVLSEPADVAWDRPDLRTSLTGHTEVTDRVAGAAVIATLEVQGVPLVVGEIEGLVRFAFRATLPPDADPATEVGVSIGDGLGEQKLRPGGTVVVYSRAAEPECDRRPACTAFSGVRLFRESDDLPAATVTWTVDVEFLSLTGVVPEGLRLIVKPPAP